MQQLTPGPPDKNAVGADLRVRPELAKPMIDTLEILKEKTRANLTPEEVELLNSVLLDLRLRYLRAVSIENTTK
jgi:hypothetical protein